MRRPLEEAREALDEACRGGRERACEARKRLDASPKRK